MMNQLDTICALATPPGIGGLAVIRVSGERAFALCDGFFRGKVTLSDAVSHSLHYGTWDVDGGIVDTVTATVFRAPHSYTGEDVVEVGCHGGKHVVDQILNSLVLGGCRPATAGEYTKRAFLNRRLDLPQVEAVAEIIHSQTTVGAQTAARQLMGGFTRRLAEVRAKLTEVLGLVELELDFAEEDVSFVKRDRLLEYITSVAEFAQVLLDSAKTAQHMRAGFRVAVVGYPNAGKSALFNALLGRNRAIVSNVPGTTRDYLDESLTLHGFAFRLIDTAGLRDTSDAIEMEGIALARSILAEADLILIVNDSSLGSAHSDELVAELTKQFPSYDVVLVQSKVDLLSPEEYAGLDGLCISTVGEPGTSQLTEHLMQRALRTQQAELDVLVNQRQSLLLKQLLTHLNAAGTTLQNSFTTEYTAVDLRAAIQVIGELTGETWTINVLDDVFAKFCIGK